MNDFQLDIQALNKAKELLISRNLLLAEILHKSMRAKFLSEVIIIPDDRSIEVNYTVIPHQPLEYVNFVTNVTA